MRDIDVRETLIEIHDSIYHIYTHTGFSKSFHQVKRVQLDRVSCIHHSALDFDIIFFVFQRGPIIFGEIFFSSSDLVIYYCKLIYRFVIWFNCFMLLEGSTLYQFYFWCLMYQVNDSSLLGFHSFYLIHESLRCQIQMLVLLKRDSKEKRYGSSIFQNSQNDKKVKKDKLKFKNVNQNCSLLILNLVGLPNGTNLKLSIFHWNIF